MKWCRSGISQFVAIIFSVLIVLSIGGLLFVGLTGYVSGAGRINAFALTGQLNTQSSGEGILTVTVLNTGTTSLRINASNPGDVRIVGPGDPTINKVGPLGIIEMSPGDSMTVVVFLSGVQHGGDFIIIINLMSLDGTINAEQVRIRAR